MDDAYGAADRTIASMIASANAADPTAQHVHDDGPELGWQLSAADVAITDVSAMVYDRLATGKPLLITRPADPEARIDDRGYLSDCEWLTVDAAEDVIAEVDRVREDADAVARLRVWSQRYFGDTAPGAATARFEAAIERLMDAWDQEHARREGAG